MPPRRLPRGPPPGTFAFIGLLKAGVVLWVGPRVGAPGWLVVTAVALWAFGPTAAAWAWRRRRARGGLAAARVRVARRAP